MCCEFDENKRKDKFIILNEKLSGNELSKLLIQFPSIQWNDQTMIACGIYCEQDIELNHQFEVLFDMNNINNVLDIKSTVKYVIALRKIFEHIPSGWHVVTIFEFTEGVPNILEDFHSKAYILSSKHLHSKLIIEDTSKSE